MNVMKRIRSEYFPDTSDRILFLCGAVMLSTEIWKQLVLTLSAGGHYNLWYLPFQLCSIPMYVLLAYPWLRREKIRRVLLAFLMCYGLLGGIAAFADTSGMKYAYPALTVHSHLWHVLKVGHKRNDALIDALRLNVCQRIDKRIGEYQARH